MALSFFSGGGSSHSAKYFDIRLDEDYIVFRGNEHEASSAHLQGTVVLCLSEPLTIKHLKLHLTGMSRVCWHHGAASASRKSGRERTFFDKSWGFRDAGKGKTEIMPAGNYEFPFDVVLEGSLPESIEGLHDTWITYRFKAEIGRKYAKDIHVRKPLRIIRTLDPSALELAHAMSVENVWPNKIEYSISTPSKAVIFGTSLRVDFRLVPILKGLKIGLIATEFIESHDLTLNPEDPDAFHSSNKSTRVIVADSFELDEERQLEILDEDVEGYRFSRTLNLPKTLNKCLQDADVKGIKIRHKLKFRVQLHNPDGHTSELRATLPVSVFISPNLPIDENNNLIDQTPESAQRAALTLVDQAPPNYGEHQFDQLYSELDPNGYRTPGDASGPQTPFSSLSRNISMENIAAAVNAETQNISAAALQHRLNNLHLNGSATTPSTPPSEPAETSSSTDRPRSVAGDGTGTYSSPSILVHGVTSPDTTPGLSRRTSEEDYPSYPPSGVATPRPQFSQVEDLSRVPSYTTAVRSNLHQRSTAHDGDYLPDYQAATANDVAAASALPFPQQAHIGTTRARPQLAHHRSHSQNGNEDMERRLRLIQARARA